MEMVTGITDPTHPFGKTHIKSVFFLVVGSLRFYPPYTNGLVVHATFIEKKWFFA